MSGTYYVRKRDGVGLAVARMVRPTTRRELRAWVRQYAGLRLPERGVCAGHCTPLDYLEYVFFEEGGTGDTVVWACRGGGKTMIGAVATLLDLVFKAGIQVRILGGSKEQSEKMYTYLGDLVRGGFLDQVVGGEKGITRKGLGLRNGSRVEILTQSERAVRGTRVQKMRCDEVELFDAGVWSAAQLTTRSLLGEEGEIENGKWKKEAAGGRQGEACTPNSARAGGVVARGAVEVFSTMHRPGGLMAQLATRAACPVGELGAKLEGGGGAAGGRAGRKVFTWCVWDVVGRCVEGKRACPGCLLLPWCQGRAREGAGFLPVADVLGLYERATRQTWESEMLCHMPYPENQVFPGFRAATHVRVFPAEARVGQGVGAGGRQLRLEGVIAGLDYGWRKFACVWVALLRDESGRRVAWVIDEYVQPERELEGHAAAILARGRGASAYYADVAGRQHNAHTGRTSEAILQGAGLAVKSRAMQVEDGIRMLNGLIDPPETWGRGERVPRLLVDPRCREVIAALTNYAQKKDKPVKDGVHDHLADALRYALVGHDGGGGKVERRMY